MNCCIIRFVAEIFFPIRIRMLKCISNIFVFFSKARVGSGTGFVGVPVVNSNGSNKITIGKCCSFISASWATALGVNHAVVLRTLTEEGAIVIGNRVGMSGGTICAARSIQIGDNCLLGANVTIVDTDFHHINPVLRRDANACHLDAKPVVIGANVFIGTGAMVLKGVTIGENSVIGAGSVVVKDIPANMIAAGNPCRVIRPINANGVKQ